MEMDTHHSVDKTTNNEEPWIMDQNNTISSNLVELSDLGISNHYSYITHLEVERLDANIDNVNKNNDFEVLKQSNTDIEDIYQVNNSKSATNNNAELQDMSQSNINHPDVTNNAYKLTSPEKLDQTANNSGNLVKFNPIKIDKPIIMPEILHQTISRNIVQSSTNTRNLDQPSIHTENTDQLITTIDKLGQTTSVNILQTSDCTGDSGQLTIHSENKVQSITMTANLDQDHTDNANTVSNDQSNTGNLYQPSTSTGNLDQLGTSIENLNQVNPEEPNATVSEIDSKQFGKEKVKLFTEDKGPHWHNVVNNMITLPVIGTNLPEAFKDLPIFGKPENRADVENFYERQIRDFVGCDLNDAEFSELKDYCSIDNLRTNKEFTMTTKIPHSGIPMGGVSEQIPETGDKPELFVLRKLKNRMERDPRNLYAKKLKYRGVRLIPMSSLEEQSGIAETTPPDLEPGKDLLYRIRVYRPFMFSSPRVKAQIRGRHSVFSCDVVVCGRQPLTALRDRLVCRNDADLRLDVSRRPHDRATTTAKDMFPSGFLFINNVFYVDSRAGCYDTSAVIRTWAVNKGIGRFPVKDMAAVNMQDINVRLAHPEVYVHQGNCEHVFLVSEIRLLNYSDPLHLSCYPCHTAVSHNQTIYCTTCAEFGAKWIVTGCDRVPFDPAFFCDTCFKQYLYKDGKKIGDFKAYAYRGNELSMLKPQS